MAGLVRTLSNGSLMLALRLGLPAPPYSRKNAVIIETVGRKSGRTRRTPVGRAIDGNRIFVVAEHGPKADDVRNAMAKGGRVRVFHDGAWKDATLRITDGDPEQYLALMAPGHAKLVRKLGAGLRVVEIAPV